MKTLPFTAALCLLMPLLAAAQSTTVWRCGADGRSYSDTPCASGRALELEAARPVADVEAAQARAVRERQLAEQGLRERQYQETAALGNGLASLSAPSRTAALKPPVKVAAPKKATRKLHPPEDAGTWRAVAPGSRQRKG